MGKPNSPIFIERSRTHEFPLTNRDKITELFKGRQEARIAVAG
jgi:hypothetical protein